MTTETDEAIKPRYIQISLLTGEDLYVKDGYIFYENGMALVSSPTGTFHINTGLISIVSFDVDFDGEDDE